MKDAAVLCKELGCGAALSAPVAQFGEGSGPVVMYDVWCSGRESALRECPGTRGHLFWSHSHDAGVICSDPLQKPNISLKPNSREFVRGKRAEISCSGNYVSSSFSLYRDGEFIISQTAPENNKTAIFTISEISAGNYTCTYTTVIDGREFTSPESERLGISVSGTWTGMHTAVLAAGIVTALAIIVFIMGFCLHKRHTTVRIPPRAVPPDDTDIHYASLALGSRSENRRQVGEDKDPVYATVRV
ncbi:deleted in malignant brain tumors 1 protein-like [Callorhinchus milii]|uniref:deleted in malignant brain tumors 1 protein-like n=1 Tax=Callorhinchus milii TaxID=7868 RepID=UPI001C3FB8DB|nr:deleted in malignant brain tumors 1 protein-like [Callorhinchus milii]